MSAEDDIRDIVNRETRAWDEMDADSLVEIFHPDMVWPSPPDPQTHDPAHWILAQGRYNRDRWWQGWDNFFDAHQLIHNHHNIVMIAVSAENDGAFAVVDIDTLWRTEAGQDLHWKGRACKVYTLTAAGWKMIFQTGPLEYEGLERIPAER